MSERPKEHDWKSCVPTKSGPWVQIPLSPPSYLANEAFNKAQLVGWQAISANIKLNLVDSRVLRNKRLQTPPGPEGSNGSNPLCVPQGCLAINKLFEIS